MTPDSPPPAVRPQVVPPRRALAPLVAGALVFTTSACVLVLEILAGRLLAPYVGVTLETYTGIIGTVLAGIAAGTWYGGVLADRFDPRRLIGPLITLGGFAALTTVPLVRAVGGPLQGGGSGAILLLSIVGFLPMAALLSAVNPAVVKLQLEDLGETGTVVGRLSALSTSGAIAGTFLAGFVLVSAAAVTTLLIGVGAALVGVGVMAWIRLRGLGLLGVLGLVAGTAVTGWGSGVIGRTCDVETVYYCAVIESDPERATGRVLLLDDLRHSYVDLADPTTIGLRYLRGAVATIDVAWPEGQPLDALHIGGGGFTLPGWLAAVRPASRNVVLELDPGIVELARDRLGLRTSPELSVRIGDARLDIAEEADEVYDLVMGDAFGGRSVPWHLTTIEMVREIDRVLRPDGLYVVNLIDGPQQRFARAETATLAKVFESVVVITRPQALAGQAAANYVLVAGDRRIDVDSLRARLAENGDGDVVLAGADVEAFAGGARILTDDFAPVDQYIEGIG